MSLKQRRDHHPNPNHRPEPVFCLVCEEEITHVYDPKGHKRYWRHKRRDQGPIARLRPKKPKPQKSNRRHADGAPR